MSMLQFTYPKIPIMALMIVLSFQQTIFSSDFTQNIFDTSQGWNHQYAANSISDCQKGASSVSVYGATNFASQTLIYKNFDLPSHYQIIVSFEFWIVDYNQNYNYYIYIDNQLIGTVLGNSLTFAQNLCGGASYDGYATFSFDTFHLNNIATVILTSDVDQQSTTTSWGIRDFIVSYQGCPIQCIQCIDSINSCDFWLFFTEFWTGSSITDAEGWNYQIGAFQNINCLGQNYILINNVGDTLSKSITLNPFYLVRIQFKLIKMGVYQNEKIIFTINSQIWYEQTFNNEEYKSGCSGNQIAGDLIINFSEDFILFSSYTLQFQFSSNIAQNDRFFGIRDFYVFYSPCMKNCQLCTDYNDCQQCDINYLYDGISQCVLTVPPSPSIYTFSGNKQYFNEQIFPNNADYLFTNNVWTVCNGYSLLGGYQQINQVYINMSTTKFHNRLRLRANIYLIDNWNYANPLQLFIDGQIQNVINRNKYDPINRQYLCGKSLEPDNIHNLDITFDHTQNYTIIDFKTLDQTKQQYFGVRDIQIDYYYCGPKYKCATCDPTGVTCITCSDPERLVSNNCECSKSAGITYQTCPSCENYLYNQQICPNLQSCSLPGSYIAYCTGVCQGGFTYDPFLNQCNRISLAPIMDSYNSELISYIQQFNSPTYNQVNNWILYDLNNNLIANPIGSCGGQNVLGGVGFNGKITLLINDLPPFRRIRLQYTTILIDLEEGYSTNLYLTGVGLRTDSVDQIPRNQDLCGTSALDMFNFFDMVVQVSGQMVFEITLSNKYNAPLSPSSFGIYNISLSYQLCADQIRCATCDDNGCLTCSVPERVPGPQCLCGSYEYANYAECPTCPYKCQQNSCNQFGCLLCANADRGSPPDCLCQTYEIYGESSCPPCQQNCLYCTPTMCLQCESGYYARNEYCYKCPYQCQTCLYNSCLTCSDPLREPAPYCKCQTYEIIGQKECPLCPSNCLTCDVSGCLICNDVRLLPLCNCPPNYYEINNQCIKCQSSCLTCNYTQCLTCKRADLMLPLCICPVGSVEVNDKCNFGVEIIISYGYFDQSLKQIHISFNKEFIIQGLDESQNLNQENCQIIENSEGLCQILNQYIIYQYSDQLNYQLDDQLKLNNQYVEFINVGQYLIQDVKLVLNQDIDYKPKFDLTYPSNVLLCNQFIISIDNVQKIGYQDYDIDILNDGVINYTIQNKIILVQSLVFGNFQLGIKVINFVKEYNIKLVNIYSTTSYNVDFEVLPKLGYLDYYFDLIIFVNKIVIQNCSNNQLQNVDKIIDLNFGNLVVLRQITKNNYYKFYIQVGQLSLNEIYNLNVTITYQNYSNTILKNYSINLLNPYFSIIGGNRMINFNNNLNVSAIIVDYDNQGLICKWQCLILENSSDCGFNFTSSSYQIIYNYNLELYKSYQFIYNCLGVKVSANYYITDINQSQLYILYPIYYSTYQLNYQDTIQFYIFNETNNTIMSLMFSDISIKIIQNQSLIYYYQQSNSYGQQYLNNLEGNLTIQASVNSMIASFSVYMEDKQKNLNIIKNIEQGIPLLDVFQFGLNNSNLKDPPYMYSYFAQINNNITYKLSDWSQFSQQQFLLPQGLLSNNFSITIILQFINGLGFTNNVTSQVIVQNQNQSKVDLFIQQLNNQTFLLNHIITLGYQFLQLQEVGCLQNCSNQGICVQNECQCYEGFYLNDCSSNSTQYYNISQSLIDLMLILIEQQQENVDSQKISLLYNLLQNKHIYQNMNLELIQKLIVTTTFYLIDIFQRSIIQSSDMDQFIRRIPQVEQQMIDQENSQNLNSLMKLLDSLFGLVGYDSPIVFENKTLQNELNMQLVNTTVQLSLFKGLQQYIDQEPFQLDLKYINIISQKVSENYSQVYFQIPLSPYDQINNSEYQLQNQSVISTVIFKTNPFLADSNFPYPQTNSQVASIQIADQNGKSYRSFHPVSISFNSNQSSTKETCACQKNEQWFNNICQTIKLTNYKKVICNCEVVNQINMITLVNDFNNLYAHSNLLILLQSYGFLKFDFQNSAITYILALFTGFSILFSYIGYKKDKIEVVFYTIQKQMTTAPKQIDYDSEEEDALIETEVKFFKARNFKSEIIMGLKKLHSFFRIHTEFMINQPRPSRYIMYFLKQCILLSTTAAFGKGFTIVQNVMISVITMILIIPVEKIIMAGFGFEASNKLKIFTYIILLTVYLGCWYTCITISAGVGTNASNLWTITFTISFITNTVIMEVLTITLKIIFSPFLISFIQKGGYIARGLYLYLYDPTAIAIVKDLNEQLRRINITMSQE